MMTLLVDERASRLHRALNHCRQFDPLVTKLMRQNREEMIFFLVCFLQSLFRAAPLRHIVKNHHCARNRTGSISDGRSTVFDASFSTVFADQSGVVGEPDNYSVPQN